MSPAAITGFLIALTGVSLFGAWRSKSAGGKIGCLFLAASWAYGIYLVSTGHGPGR